MAVQAQLFSEKLVLPMSASQDWFASSVLGIDDGGCFNLLEEPQFHQQQGLQSLGFSSDQMAFCLSTADKFLPMECSLSLAAELEKQRQELELFLHLQSERLRATLQEETRRQVAMLLQRYQSKMMKLMWEKEEGLAVAAKKTMELEDCLRRQESEIQAWQRIAKQNEATVTSLSNALQQARERVISLSSVEVPDSESFCDSSGNRGVKEEEQSRKMACKSCNARRSCIVFLPCRHLCSCKLCEAFLGVCPVCEATKKASLEVSLV